MLLAVHRENAAAHRWRLFKLHVEHTSDGYVITEFLPKVFWSGPHNTISCPAGHHIMEGRWVHNRQIVDDYARFWFRRARDPEDKKVWEKMYTFWAASSIYNHFLVSGNTSFILDLRPELEAFYESYVATHYHPQHQCMYDRVGCSDIALIALGMVIQVVISTPHVGLG